MSNEGNGDGAHNPKKKWEKVRNTTTRTEIQTTPDNAVQDLFSKSGKSDPALVIVQGDQLGQVYRIPEGLSRIGRHSDCEVIVQQRLVSSFHAELRRTDRSVILEDLKSTNGTILNKEKLTRPVVLQKNDLVKIGSSVFKYIDNQLEAEFAESLHLKGALDSMTGIYNKGYLLKSLASSMDVAKSGFPLSLIMFDLDHFKKVNDTHGHLAGDFVLKETVRVIKESGLRMEDVFGRYGGEEFMIIMPDAPLKVAMSVAERIRKTIETHVFEFSVTKIPVTNSLGVCTWTPETKTAEEMIEAADKLLYRSKQGGRNRVTGPESP